MKPTTKFKSAAELGLTPKTYAALRWTRKLLRGDLKAHVKHEIYEHPVRPKGNLFNMSIECDKEEDRYGHPCGTTACIGGWMAIHALGIRPNAKGVVVVKQAHRVSHVMHNMAVEGLNKLFYPGEEVYLVPGIHNWSDITTKRAVKAIEYYMSTGEIDWFKALVPPPKPVKPKRKTADELGLTTKQYRALVWTRNQLATEAISHKERARNGFNMAAVCMARYDASGHSCGTIACIGGWMALRLCGIRPTNGVYLTNGREHEISAMMDLLGARVRVLHNLFYPHDINYYGNYVNVTNAQAVTAIDNYLLTGKVDWRHANA